MCGYMQINKLHKLILLFLPCDAVFLCNSLYSYKDFCATYGKNGTIFPVYFWSVCVKVVPYEQPEKASSEPQNSHGLKLVA